MGIDAHQLNLILKNSRKSARDLGPRQRTSQPILTYPTKNCRAGMEFDEFIKNEFSKSDSESLICKLLFGRRPSCSK